MDEVLHELFVRVVTFIIRLMTDRHAYILSAVSGDLIFKPLVTVRT